MSAARRQRLREAIQERASESVSQHPPLGITEQKAEQIKSLPHVENVTPSFTWNGQIDRNDNNLNWILVRVISEDDPSLLRRLVAGRPAKVDEEAIYVSEYLVYQLWNIRDEEQVVTVLDRPARLNLSVNRIGEANLLALLNVSRPNLSNEEQRVLKKLIAALPTALTQVQLEEAERQILTTLLQQAKPGQTPAVIRSLPVVGVFRDVGRHELGPWDSGPLVCDVMLSTAAARSLFYAVPGRAQTGFPSVSVRVDREEHLRRVEEQIRELGFATFSFADILDQIRLNSLAIQIACSLIAIISLTVASLGITNTMLMSVLERTFEIGVMKATGAQNKEVMQLFLLEGLLLGSVGAVLGLISAWLFTFPGDHLAHWLIETRSPMKLDQSVFLFRWWSITLVPLCICVLTTLAALYPARRAARIDPIEALRQRG